MQQRGHVQVIRVRDASDKGGMTESKDSDDSTAAARDRLQYEAQGLSALPDQWDRSL